MKIVIVGAGAVGFHLAELLSKENQDITLIDSDGDVLEKVGSHLDVMTIEGDGNSLDILKEAMVSQANLFIAVTNSESANLFLAILAKQQGAKKTIARVNNPEYFEPDQKQQFLGLGVDVLISPEILAAQEVERLLQRGPFSDIFEFEQGKVAVVGFTVDFDSPLVQKEIREIKAEESNLRVRPLAILRGGKTIIPKDDDLVRKGDHIYLTTKNNFLDKTCELTGKTNKRIKKVMLIGGSSLALKVAKSLERNYSVSIVVNQKVQAKQFFQKLKHSLIIHADPSDIETLKEEGLEMMDAFIALTPNSEINIISSLMAEEAGVHKTIALVDNVNYTHISQNIGIDTIINKKLIAANNIFRFVRKGKVEAIASLHGVEAEMIEFIIHKRNRLIKHPLSQIHLPENTVVAGVIRGEEGIIPNEDFNLEIDDRVIVFTLPEAISVVEEIFK